METHLADFIRHTPAGRDAEEILRVQENYPASLYLNMAMGFILFTKSMFTFTPEDVEKAIDQMELVLKMAKKFGRGAGRISTTSAAEICMWLIGAAWRYLSRTRSASTPAPPASWP